MWTVCWFKLNIDGHAIDCWERFSTTDDVHNYLMENKLESDEDVLIFPPSSECLIPEEFINRYGKEDNDD